MLLSVLVVESSVASHLDTGMLVLEKMDTKMATQDYHLEPRVLRGVPLLMKTRDGSLTRLLISMKQPVSC